MADRSSERTSDDGDAHTREREKITEWFGRAKTGSACTHILDRRRRHLDAAARVFRCSSGLRRPVVRGAEESG